MIFNSFDDFCTHIDRLKSQVRELMITNDLSETQIKFILIPTNPDFQNARMLLKSIGLDYTWTFDKGDNATVCINFEIDEV